MERKHSSFLLRCWWRNNDLERIEIEHIQSGKRGLVSSFNDAVTWISSQGGDPEGAGEEDGDIGGHYQQRVGGHAEQTKGDRS